MANQNTLDSAKSCLYNGVYLRSLIYFLLFIYLGISLAHADTIVLGVGMDGQLYQRIRDPQGGWSAWRQTPNVGGAVMGVAIMNNGAILGIGMDNKLYTRASLNSNWIKAPDDGGAVMGVTTIATGVIIGIGMDNKLYTRASLNSVWVKAPDDGGAVIAITTTIGNIDTVYNSFYGHSLKETVWLGSSTAWLTLRSDRDPNTMAKIVTASDGAYRIYKAITGREPVPSKVFDGRSILAEVPDGLTCGAGCGYLGSTGIELSSLHFDTLYNGVTQRNEYDQAMFYEFGRNFWFYGNQLGVIDSFVTGFAIANRFIAIDRLGLIGGPFGDLPYSMFRRSILFDLFAIYLNNPTFNWSNTLAIGKAPPNEHNWGAADLAASIFYRIYYEKGISAYQRFYTELSKKPTATTQRQAIDNFISSALVATGKDYSYLFFKTGGNCQSSITVGSTISGSWVAGCNSTHRSGSYAKFYTFTLTAPQTVVINLSSTTADAYLYLLSGNGTGGTVLNSPSADDDAGGGNNAKTTKTLAAGTYTIEATTYESSKASSFSLSINGSSNCQVSTPPQPGRICLDNYNPVCGCDGRTYSNACYANRDGVTVNYQGVCR